MTVNIFEQASRRGLRFPSVVGNITVTDLWELPIRTTRSGKASLENVGNGLLQKQAELGTTSILGPDKASDEQMELELQIEIVRHIITVRTTENQAKTAAAAKRSQAARLDEIIAQRKATETPLDDLIAQRAALGG